MTKLREGKFQGIGYMVSGRGPTLFLVHGLSRRSAHWLDFPERLAQYFEVITLDNRGVGSSKERVSTWMLSTKQMAQDAAAVARHLKIEQAHLVGLSLGGMVALQGLVLQPRLWTSATVINSSVGGFSDPRIHLRSVARLVWASQPWARNWSEIYDILVGSGAPQLKEKVIQKWKAIDSEEPLDLRLVVKQLKAAHIFDDHQTLRRIQQPVQVICAQDDAFVPAVNSYHIASLLQNHRLEVVSDGGHELMISHADWLVERICDFMLSSNKS